MARNFVGEIFLNTRAVDGGVNSDVQKIIDQTNAKAQAKIPVAADTRQAEESVARLTGSVQDGLGGAFAQAAIQAAGFTAAVIGIQRTVEGTLGKFAGLFDQLAQAQAGFTAILGSAQAGGQLLDDIREFARVSPFVTQELVNYSQQLLGVGQAASSIVPLLKSTGDLIASVGGDTQNISRVLFTLTQIRSIGRLVGQDAIQLQSALVPITKLLADFLGKTTQEVKKLQEQGAISADTVFAAITAAGGKVEGAMNNATRNIGGARAVLSDTITILFQNSEDLRAIFDDIVQGILSFSEALGDPEVQRTIDSVTEGIGTLYDSLKPVLEGLSGAAGVGALSFLNILASTLEALGTIVNSIPTVGLQAIGTALAALAALKAPLYLIQYVSSLRTLGAAISPAGLGKSVTGLTNNLKVQESQLQATTAATEKAAVGYSNLGAKMKVALNAAAAAGLIGGQILQGGDSQTGDLIGGALTGASLGAATTGFNPFGIAAGAGVGIVTTLITQSRKEAEDREDELEQIGAEMANKLIGGFLAVSPTGLGTQSGLDFFFGDSGVIAKVESDVAEAQALLDTLTAGTGVTQFGGAVEKVAGSVEDIKAATEALAAMKAQQDEVFIRPEVADFLDSTASKLGELNKIQPINPDLFKPIKDLDTGQFFSAADAARQFALVTGQAAVESREDFVLLEDGLKKIGIATGDLSSSIAILALKANTDLPEALRASKDELDTFKTKLDEATKIATGFFQSFAIGVNILKSSQEQSAKFAATFEALTTGAATNAEGLAFATELLAGAQTTAAAVAVDTKDDAKGIAAGNAFLSDSLNVLQESLGQTDEEFIKFLKTIGLYDAYVASRGADTGFTGNINELSESTGVAVSRLQEILNLTGALDNREVDLIINAQTEDAITQIGALERNLDGMSADGVDRAVERVGVLEERLRFLATSIRGVEDGDTGGAGLSRSEIDDLIAAAARRPQVDTTTINNKFRSQTGEARREAERLAAEAAEKARKEAERLAEEARREAEARAREAEALANAIRSAGDSLESAIQGAADAISQAADGWESSIRERTQFERALSTERLTKNTGRQVADLTELGTGIQSLLDRGLSQDAIDAIGIDNVADLRQVRKLLLSDPADLAALSALVAQRDDASEKIAERAAQEQTKNTMVTAIVEAAKILGFQINDETAVSIAAQFNINQDTDAAQFGQNILDFLLNSGQIAR